MAAMWQENKASKNAGWLKQNLPTYNDLLTAYRLAYREMDYYDAPCEAVKYCGQLKQDFNQVCTLKFHFLALMFFNVTKNVNINLFFVDQ